MYRFSRSIYRELSRDILEEKPGQWGPSNHERVLRACEAAVFRLATDWPYLPKTTKALFNDIRIYFPMSAQERVYRVVDRYMTFAKDYFSSMPMSGYDIEGRRIECRATTRRGTPRRPTPRRLPCQITSLPANGYCPSHQPRAEPDEVAIAA